MSLSRASLAVAYHAPVKRHFVLSVLMPAADRVARARGVRHVHLARHWRFGPHLQLVATGEDADAVRAALRAEQPGLTAAVQAAPSDYRLRHAEYLRTCEELGRAELVPPPYEPIWPDNSVRFFETPLEPGLIEEPAAKDLRDAFCAGLLEPLRQTIAAAQRNPSARLIGAATLMIVLAGTYPDRGLFHGYLSFKSHLEDHLQDYDPGGELRADFARRYEPAREAFERLVVATVDTVDSPAGYAGDDRVLGAWSASLEGSWRVALELAGDKAILPLLHDGYLRRAGELNDHLRRKYLVGDDREYSDFHATLREHTYDDPVGGRWFASYRFMVNLLYTQLLVADVSPAERLFLAYAISEAVQSVTGTTWQQILRPQDVQGVQEVSG